MADYTDLPDTAVGIGGIPSGTTVTALRDNPIAIAERAVGAPKVQSDFQFLEQIVITSGDASADFTAFDNTQFKSYKFVFEAVKPTTDGISLLARTSTDAGVSFDSGASDYQYRIFPDNTAGAATTTSGIIICSVTGNAATDYGFHSELHLTGAVGGVYAGLTGRGLTANTVGTLGSQDFVGARDSTTAIDAIRFEPPTGTLLSGVITMYGLRND